MISIYSRSRLAAAVSPLALAMALTATPAWADDAQQATITGTASASAATATAAASTAAAAQDQAQPATSNSEANPQAPNADQSSVVVTGFRAALRSATATKKRTAEVVEAVNAEDIGKLPDNGIGESIARLPGISSQRNQGRATHLDPRFRPRLSITTLNGREQTTTNDSRAVEFDQFPSEILNQVVVYKTPAANLTSQGLVGTIDLRTIRPLDAWVRYLAVGARGTYTDQKLQPDAHKFGWPLRHLRRPVRA